MNERLKGRTPLAKGVGFLEEFSKDEIKGKVDIAALFASFGVQLEKKGSSWMGLCPFHEDKNPSLSVDAAKGLYHCFGCGEGGDVFELVMKYRNLDFKEALDFLKDFASTAVSTTGSPRRDLEMRALESSPSLADVIAAYRKNLEASGEARDYLQARGLMLPELLSRFSACYSSGDLIERLGSRQRAALEEMSILKPDGREHFAGCIILPLLSLQGEPLSLYGRRIDERKEPKHLYMSGPHRGLLNPAAYKAYPDGIILTESILDALSLMAIGFQNTDSLYGAGSLSNIHMEALEEAGTREVILALDNDDAGRKGAAKIAEKLKKKGIGSRRIFPPCKDWNEYLTQGGEVEEKKGYVRGLIREASLMRPSPPFLRFSARNGRHMASSSELVYQVIRLSEGFSSSFKVNIRASRNAKEESTETTSIEPQMPGRLIIDNVDLYSARSRTFFANQLAGLHETLEPARIERELIGILDYLERLDEAGKVSKSKGPPALSPGEEKEGLTLLRNPELFQLIEEDLEELGYVGEGVNKRLMYLSASSRKMDSPISIIVHSQSASGKSCLIDTVKRLMPPEDVVSLTSLSDQALNYMEDDALISKFLTLGELVHSESVEYQLREMLSSGELSRLVTAKDDTSGRMVSHMVRKKVRVAMVMSTARSSINEENASRSFLISIDESQNQTEAIHRRQREKYSFEAYRKREEAAPAIIARHQAAQRLLEAKMIVNPFAGLLSFPSSQMRTRRDHERFIDLIAAVCFLRQYQKESKTSYAGKSYIECDIEDYRVAHQVMSQILPSTLGELPASAKRVYEETEKLVESRALHLDIPSSEIRITQRELREHSGLGHELIKKNLRLLAEWEYVRVRGAVRGSSKRYGLGPRVESKLISLLPTVSEMEERIEGARKIGKTKKVGQSPEDGLSLGITKNKAKSGSKWVQN